VLPTSSVLKSRPCAKKKDTDIGTGTVGIGGPERTERSKENSE
jgi:hypothetical protein